MKKWACCQCMREFDYEPVLVYRSDDDVEFKYQFCSVECAGDFRDGVVPWEKPEGSERTLLAVALWLLILIAIGAIV